ncbi:DUF4148 domain-containing protein [Caballeronia sp. LZ001]|uniref:DUF4148 domain-containing protein n=1 Tax=Caballeronia sp. LZ001 TaxID=3038553 RepID=UPI002859EE9D|nr:DUF4148 domain-containing protein [Caballeronia sp. LZ001]MDR5806264.1 DUF4148 domain-containing protein [Caballeronia sp. LZ001]
MNLVKLAAVSAALVLSSGAFAQSLTRAEVRAQLVQAEQNGSRLVVDASYPDVSPIYQNQVAHANSADTTSYGGAASTRDSGNARMNMSASQCVGPYSFCHIYAGS